MNSFTSPSLPEKILTHPARKIAKATAEKFKRNFRIYRQGNGLGIQHLKKIAAAEPTSTLRHHLQCHARVLGHTSDGHIMYLYETNTVCPVLKEIGRLREIAFRAVGEGSGKACDLDHHDFHYQHLILWNQEQQDIVGAYRWIKTSKLSTLSQLYSASLFDYHVQAHEHLKHGLELGRSFVQPKYWGKRSLDYLWQGIGAYLRHNPEITHLFGPVSLSDDFSVKAKSEIVSFYRTFFP